MIEIKDIEKLTKLARIEISPEEKEKMLADLNAILQYVGQIKEAQSKGNPTETASNSSLSKNYEGSHAKMVKNVFREDGQPHQSEIYTEKLLSGAPERKGNYVKVKNIL